MSLPATTIRSGIGIEGVVVALQLTDPVGGTPTYSAPVALAGAAKMTVNPNGSIATDWYDDGPGASATTTGLWQVDFEVADVVPTTYASIFGISRANGINADSSTDTSPYLAFGYKQWLGGLYANGAKVFRYVWLAKGVLAKSQQGGETKKDKINYQHMTLKGEFVKLNANNLVKIDTRTDDPDVLATTLTNWFTQPVTTNSADLSAFTLVVTTGSGAAGTLLFTFSKASNSGSIPFTVPAATITALASSVEILKVSDGSLVTATYALLSAGTGFSNSTVTVTCTTALTATAVYVQAPVADGLVDGSGVVLTAYQSGSKTTHA